MCGSLGLHMSRFGVSSVLALVALALALPAAAAANTVTTGPAHAGADPASARLHISVTPSCTLSPSYGAEWYRVSDPGTLTSNGVDAPAGGQPFDGDVDITGLVPGGVYRYRAYGFTYCEDGNYLT